MGITLESVNYTYQAGTPFEGRALFDINLSIKEGLILLLSDILDQVSQRLCSC